MILHGRNLIIKAGGVAIAAARSCEINIQTDEIETASPDDGSWKHVIAGRKSWSINVSYLVPSGTFPTSAQMVGTIVTLNISDGSVQMQGSALVKAWKTNGTLGNLSQGSYQFTGNGELSPVTQTT